MNPEKKKILYITARADYGGGPEHIYSLLKSLHEEYSFYIACPDDIPYKKKYEDITGKDKIFLLPHRKFRSKYLFRLKSFTVNNNIDLIHSHGKGAGIYGRLLSVLSKTPVVHTFHGIHVGSYNKYQKKLYAAVEKALSFKTKVIISVSESEKRKAVRQGIAPLSKITVIKNGVEIPQAKAAINLNEIHLSTITRFDEQKNSELLIPIAKLLKQKLKKQFIIHFIGSGEREETIKAAVIKNGLSKNFIFHGFQLKPSNILENSNCYISTSKWEGLPIAVLEAMALGLPVVATNVTGNKDAVINKRTGYLFDINKPEEGAGCIANIFDDDNLWNEFSIAARERITKDFSLDKMAEATNKLYEQLLKNN